MTDLPEVPPLKKPARPWDLFNKNIEKVSSDIQKDRMAICTECPELIQLTKQCKKCGCFMEAKTRLPHSFCPIGKWDSIDFNENSVSYKE